MSALAPTLQAWFTDRLIAQRNVSPHTIRAYRDTLRLLLDYAEARLGRQPSQLDIAELDAAADRRVPRSPRDRTQATASPPATRAWRRSTRCSATPSTATPNTPRTSPACSRSRSSGPTARSSPSSTRTRSTRCSTLPTGPPGPADATTRCSSWPSRPGCAPPSSPVCDAATSSSRPDAHIRCAGKGRKNRITPLTPTTTAVLEVWLAERAGHPDQPAFPTSRDGHLTRDALDHRLDQVHRHRRRNAARPCTRSESRRTRSGTPRRCASCTRASTPPSSLCG